MRDPDLNKLYSDLVNEIVEGAGSIVLVGFTPAAVEVIGRLTNQGLVDRVLAVAEIRKGAPIRTSVHSIPVVEYAALQAYDIDVLVIASDSDKETRLRAVEPYVRGFPKVVISGYGQFAYVNSTFNMIRSRLRVPSLANGYENSLIHLYQCLENSVRLGLHGVVAEFGMFKGGTTLFLAYAIEALRADWHVIGFDTFSGFPQRKSLFDMYDNSDCEFSHFDDVRIDAIAHNIEIVRGDIAETCSRLRREDVVVSFLDTDNYTPTRAALEVLRDRTVLGGAIVFDHFTGRDRFRYTLGERMAAQQLIEDSRYFNLHGTGVFVRQA